MRSLSDIFKDLEDRITGDSVSIDALLEAFHERGFGFFLFFFALPAALPIPAVGVGTILGLPLVFLIFQMAIGRHTIWFPSKIKQKNISRKRIDGMINASLPWLTRLEKVIKPRLEFVTQGVFSNMIGIFALVMALAVCVPLPLTNTIPSFGIALMAIGIIMRDGLAVIVGTLIGTAWVCLLAFILIYLGTEGIDLTKEYIKGLIT